MGQPAPPDLQPLLWAVRPWEHLQLDICEEPCRVPHHQRFLLLVYDLYSKWPVVVSPGTVTARVLTDFLDPPLCSMGTPSGYNSG